MKKRTLTICNFIVLFIVLFIFIVYPFFRYNQLLQWDTIGHHFSSWHIKEHLFPQMTGWNPYFFAGFPQGNLYPSLFHYLVALFSFVLPLQIAFKLLVVAAIIFSPFAFYYFTRSLKYNQLQSSVIMLLMNSILALPLLYSTLNNIIGGNYVSTFNIGLVSNALAIPLFFFYAGNLLRNFPRNRYIGPSVLFTLLLLTHFFVTISAILFTLALALMKLRTWNNLKYFLKHVVLTILLSCFWLIPFFVNFNFTTTIKVNLILGLGSFSLIILGLILIFANYLSDKIKKIRILTIFFLVVMLGMLIVNLLAWNLHVYRFIFPAVLLIPIFLVNLCNKKWQYFALGTLALIGLIWGINYNWAFKLDVKGPDNIQEIEIDKELPGRTLILANDGEQLSPHINQHLLPMKNNFYAVKGLFVESSKNSLYLLAIEKMLDTYSRMWGVPLNELVTDFPQGHKKILAKNHFKNFGINGVIASQEQYDFDYIDREEIFSYLLDRNYGYFTINDQRYEFLLRDDAVYFYLGDDYLVLVDKQYGNFNLSIFSVPVLTVHNKLKSGDTTYYIDKLDEQIYLVDFTVKDKFGETEAKTLSQIESAIEGFNLTDNNKDRIEWLLTELKAELHQTDVNYAKKKYQDYQLIKLENISKVTIRTDELETFFAPKEYKFFHYKLLETQLVEILDYSPEVIKENWEGAINNWFFSPKSDKILVYAKEDISLPIGNGEVEIQEISTNQDYLKFDVLSEEEVPVLIKISYFPKWKAYANGRPIDIYKASPNLMLIKGKGEIELIYQTLWYEYLAYTFSILAVVFIIFRTIVNKTKIFYKNG